MSISFMHEAVKISDRFSDSRDPDSIDRKGQLNQVVILVVIFHAIMGIAFVKMEEYERKHPRLKSDMDLQFQISIPAPEPEFRVVHCPKPIGLIEESPEAKSSSKQKSRENQKVTLPVIKAEQTQQLPSLPPATPQLSRETIVQPPIAVLNTNMVKSLPSVNLTGSPNSKPLVNTVGPRSESMPSGAAFEGGDPAEDDSNGSGSGQSDDGTGTGTGTGVGDHDGSLISRLSGNSSRASGNIAPYRKELLIRIAANWHPRKKAQLVLVVEIAADGSVSNVEVKESSGSNRVDAEAVSAVESTEFPPLPKWYGGDSLRFEIDLQGGH